MIARPTAVDPVKATLSTPGWPARWAPTSSPTPVTTLRTPGGRPHASAIWAKRSIDSGVFSSGLRTMEFPAAKAGPTFQSDRANG